MNKYTKWGIVGVVVVGLSIVGYNSLMPHQNEELKTGGVPGGKGRQSKTLNVRAVVMGEQELTDGIFISGSLVPDEEVNLSFETSGKITDIYLPASADDIEIEGIKKLTIHAPAGSAAEIYARENKIPFTAM